MTRVRYSSLLVLVLALGGSLSAQPAPSPLLPFWPQGGTPGADLECTKYFTHVGPGEVQTDYRCGGVIVGPDLHYGTDSLIRSFAEQAAGVPIFAARTGCVETAVDLYCDACVQTGEQSHDGCENPENAPCIQRTSNTVTLDHGDGLFTLYTHLKKNSIPAPVKPTAQTPRPCVYAGQYIGDTASSGASAGPHLHFQIFNTQPGAFDPFGTPTYPEGVCTPPTDDYWVTPPPFGYDQLRIWDVTLTHPDEEGVPPNAAWPFSVPRNGFLDLNGPDRDVYVWFMLLFGENKNVTASYQLQSPLGQVHDIFGPAASVPVTSRIFGWSKLLSLAGVPLYAGQWTVIVTVNSVEGTIVVQAPLEVGDEGDTNTAPKRPTAVALSPSAPTDEDALFCTVAMPLIVDNDYDLVKYRYVWENMNTEVQPSGVPLRDVTHAGQGDALSCDLVATGMEIQVTVTAVDPSGATSQSRTAGPVTISEDPSDTCTCSCTAESLGRWSAFGVDGRTDAPRLQASGDLQRGQPVGLRITGAPAATALLVLTNDDGKSIELDDLRRLAGSSVVVPIALDRTGVGLVQWTVPGALAAREAVQARAWVLDPAAVEPPVATNGLRARVR